MQSQPFFADDLDVIERAGPPVDGGPPESSGGAGHWKISRAGGGQGFELGGSLLTDIDFRNPWRADGSTQSAPQAPNQGFSIPSKGRRPSAEAGGVGNVQGVCSVERAGQKGRGSPDFEPQGLEAMAHGGLADGFCMLCSMEDAVRPPRPPLEKNFGGGYGGAPPQTPFEFQARSPQPKQANIWRWGSPCQPTAIILPSSLPGRIQRFPPLRT